MLLSRESGLSYAISQASKCGRSIGFVAPAIKQTGKQMLYLVLLLLAWGRMTADPDPMDAMPDHITDADLAVMEGMLLEDEMRETMASVLSQLRQPPLEYSSSQKLQTITMFNTAFATGGVLSSHFLAPMEGETKADAIVRFATILTKTEEIAVFTGGIPVQPERAKLFNSIMMYKVLYWRALPDQIYSDFVEAILGKTAKRGLLTRYAYLRTAWAINLFRSMHGLPQFLESAIAASIRFS